MKSSSTTTTAAAAEEKDREISDPGLVEELAAWGDDYWEWQFRSNIRSLFY